jgi:hypothetical protein
MAPEESLKPQNGRLENEKPEESLEHENQRLENEKLKLARDY